MKIENVSFPYPVQGIGNDIESTSQWQYTVDQDKVEYIIKVNVHLNNRSIEEYINKGKAEYICEIECASTFMRRCECSKDGRFDIRISKSDVAREVTLELSVVVKEDIDKYINTQLNPIFADYEIRLEPGDLLAYIGKGSFSADIVYEKLNKVSTFMIIREGSQVSQTEINLNADKIEILIPSEMYKHYIEEIKGSSIYSAIIHGSLVYNALLHALNNITAHSDTLWARCIMAKIEREADIAKLNIDPTDEEDREEFPKLAQALLGDPFKRLFIGVEKIYESLNFDVEE